MAKAKPIPSQARLKELFDYDPEAGILRWKTRQEMVGNRGNWNRKYAGKIAGHIKDGTKYVVVRIDRCGYQAHRIVWVIEYGTEPPKLIDHIDGNPSNNIITNLRPSSDDRNAQNIPRLKNTPSGFLGVHFHKRQKKWIASADTRRNSIRGRHHLGSYNTPEEASKVAHEWRLKNFPGYTGRDR
jgi:hypothetical protein